MAKTISKDERYKFILNKLYPNGSVYSLQQQHSSLYQEVRNHAKEQGKSVKEYILGLGFQYERKNQKIEFSLEEALEILNSLFPNKIIDGISILQKKHTEIYNSLREYANAHNKKPYDILVERGYMINSSYGTQHEILYDIPSMIKLKYEYNFNISEFARWFNTTKQNIDQKFSKKRNLRAYWQETPLSSDDINLIKKLIKDRVV